MNNPAIRNYNLHQVRIINLSSYRLSKDEEKLLSLGLKFCPTPRTSLDSISEDLEQFTRKLRLAEFFHSRPEDTQTE